MQGLLLAGRYRLADPIGSGGMGRVWRAHDEVLHRAVAIKELTAALYVSESEQGVLLARTRAEARAAARINHSAVVTVHDVLEHDGRPWIVMELVEGNSLADEVKEQGRIEPREAARIGLWVLRALRAAHAAGVVHRDVKPGNVLLGRDRRVLLTDFGIAQIEGDTTITRTGEVVGSVDYLAPERVRGQDPGPASDLWALGATLYTAVEGRSPFRRTSPLSTMQAVVEEEAVEPQYAGPLAPVITALLRKDPAQRPDAAQTEQMLAEAAEGRRPHMAQEFLPTQHTGSLPGEDRTVTGTAARYGAPVAASEPRTPVRGATVVAQAPVRSRRRRMRTVALVIAMAAVAGGFAAVVLHKLDSGSGGGSGNDNGGGGASPSVSTQPSPPASPIGTPAQDGTIPANWRTVHDPLGFAVSLPPGWVRKPLPVKAGIAQVDYTPDNGVHFVRIGIDSSPDFAQPIQHQQDLEQQLQRRLVGYQRVTLVANTYRDRSGALWEWRWNALKKDPPYIAGPRHAIEETYIARNGTEYALNMSSPAQDWARTNKQFKWVLQSWQPNTA